MKKLISDFIRANKIVFLNHKYRNESNLQTGVSLTNRQHLLEYKPFTIGSTDLFGSKFHFSHGPSFIHSVDEIFGEEVYKFKCDNDAPYIIDCGANIGLSIYYFKKIFPKSSIIAFEPDNIIFELLEKNIRELNDKSIHLYKAAVWKEDTILSFYSEGALAGSSVTDFGSKNNVIKVEAVDLKKYLNRKIDFLKIDIEGAENELIFNIAEHLENVQNLFLEYHGLLDEEQNLGEILNLLKNAGFQYYIRVADETLKYPFLGEAPRNFNQQLNIFCYRKSSIIN